MKRPYRCRSATLRAAICTALLGPAWAAHAQGQDADTESDVSARSDLAQPQIEEVFVTGRLQSAATDVVTERIDQEVVADYLGADQIARTGDSTVSLALRRLPGVTLVRDQFIYVRSLGERYSSVTLNGALVPSPDLTRSVIPLDIFPAEIIDSLEVRKGYTPELWAAFGGGNIDIRTRAIPTEPLFSVEIGTAWNSDSGDNGLSYDGGGDDFLGEDDGTRALPGEINSALQTYVGNLSPTGIFNQLVKDGNTHTFDEAQAINREVATSLNRDIGMQSKSLDPDLNLEAVAGNRWYFGENERWEFGALGVVSYANQWRNRNRVERSVAEPDTDFAETQRTINGVSLTGALNLGLNFTADHEIKTTSMYLRTTDDEASITTGHNFNFPLDDGRQFREYRIRYEERDLTVNQISGRHTLGADTRALVPFLDHDVLDGLTYAWYYSDTKATTDIPNETLVSAVDQIDPANGDLLSTSIRASGSAADYRFTDLEDDVETYGWDLSKPFTFDHWDVEVSGGWDYSRKGRGYLQTQLQLGSTSAPLSALTGGPDAALTNPADVFTDDNITNPANGFVLNSGGIGTESYLAGQTVDGAYGRVDLNLGDSWRVTGGARWEQFSQASLPIDPLEYDVDVGQTPIPPDQLDEIVFIEDDVYPALALTYMKPGFWAEEFQLRFGASQTVARPDLREISASTFIDPLTEARVRGNPNLTTSDLTNFDIRAEWFFNDGDNFTVSLFYKDIDSPIETVRGAGSDDNVALTFVNGEQAELYGVELEWFKSLAPLAGKIGKWTQYFFFAGNLTVSDSEITIGDAALNLTNNKRAMSQQSDYVANLQLGFDAPNDKHSASLVYNFYSERLFAAGRGGAPDEYEQPFHSLDFIYTYYPLEALSLRLRLQNILDEDLEIEQIGVTTFEQEFGITAKLDLKYQF
jgi:TonB-dependent receptor